MYIQNISLYILLVFYIFTAWSVITGIIYIIANIKIEFIHVYLEDTILLDEAKFI